MFEIGGETFIVSTGLDVTDRRRAEEQQARLSQVVEQTAESIVITDPGGTILYVNPAFEAVSGYTRAEAIGQNPRILKSGNQDAAFYRRMWEVLARGEVWTGRLINRRKDGILFEEHATIGPVRDAAGRVTSYVAVKRDVTNETRLERQLLQAQKIDAVGALPEESPTTSTTCSASSWGTRIWCDEASAQTILSAARWTKSARRPNGPPR